MIKYSIFTCVLFIFALNSKAQAQSCSVTYVKLVKSVQEGLIPPDSSDLQLLYESVSDQKDMQLNAEERLIARSLLSVYGPPNMRSVSYGILTLAKLSDNGNALATTELMRIVLRENNGRVYDRLVKRGIELLSSQSRGKYPPGLVLAGLHCSSTGDESISNSLIEDAIGQGSAVGLWAKAKILNEKGVLTQWASITTQEVKMLYTRAAEEGYAPAYVDLGALEGSVLLDKGKMFQSMHLAKENGVTLGFFNLGLLYMIGDGTKADSRMAIKLLSNQHLITSDMGVRSAELLAHIYTKEYNDIESGIYWTCLAATQGNRHSRSVISRAISNERESTITREVESIVRDYFGE